MGTSALRRIWLVDDHPIIRAGYRRLIELERDLVVEAEFGDAEAALARCVAGGLVSPPDAAVVDLSLPRGNGMELTRQLKRRWPGVPVLVFSMHDSAAIVGESIRAGASGFVSKGVPPEELVACLLRVLAGESPVFSTGLVPRQLERAGPPPAAAPRALTSKEVLVLRQLADGQAIPSIGDQLGMSPKTVSNHLAALRRKLNAKSAIELIRVARDLGHVA